MPSGRSPVSSDTGEPPDSDTDARVRLRAYAIWESEGRSGDAEEHWLRAEREIRGASHGQEVQGKSGPPSEDAEKMVEQVKVAMDTRNARSKQTKRAGATGNKETGNTGPKTTAPGSKKGEPRRPK
jgi:hypothetical protein